ncbi:hypothetical protein [Streptomyces longwoodensis]|uniref:hypothetical protein n=1 Tax=Streptomyces longwoodensis TaxID=68231 RepID=UPI0036E36DF0
MVGLVISAVATYYTGLALRDQQTLNKAQDERDHRSQAAQVGFWYSYSQPSKEEVAVVSNRSPDAIYQLTVRFSFPQFPSDLITAKESSLKEHEVEAEYAAANLPPCTQLVFTKKALHAAFDQIAERTHADVEQPVSTTLAFEDAQGAKWVRGITLSEVGSLNGFGLSTKDWGKRLRSGELVADISDRELATTRPYSNCESA